MKLENDAETTEKKRSPLKVVDKNSKGSEK
jgi:hypothetical protein